MKNTTPTDRELYDFFDGDNDTGFSTEDLVKIYRAHQSNDWEAVSFTELMAEIDRITKIDGENSTKT